MSGLPSTPLEKLAARCGIEPSYQSATGQLKKTTTDTRVALLKAMGISAHDEASARVALADLDAEDWSHVLSPVHVLHQSGEPMRIPITMPQTVQQFHWRLVTEEGHSTEGDTNFALLAIAEISKVKPDMQRRYWLMPSDLPMGYHQLSLDGKHFSSIIVAPGRCWLPTAVEQGERLWGLSAQVYLLRSRQNWGIGDYTDLKRLVEMLVPLRADIVGVNPLHAMFLDDPEQASPYSPASRLLLNVLNIDVAEVARQTPQFDMEAALRDSSVAQQLEECRKSSLVDYLAVSKIKVSVLESLFSAWLQEPRSERWQGFEQFRRNCGESFTRDVTFLALREHFAESGRADWHRWPPAFQNPDSPEVRQFAVEHSERITYQACLQYWADSQLAAVAQAGSAMAVGLYRDLAVGANETGAETWSNQTAVMGNVHVGAPPDIYNPAGQNWGLPPFNPRALRAEGYRSFIELIRANMRHAGGLRIDHVMALQHLYWVPAGCPPSAGAYVRYPLMDLVGILKLESVRHRCLIVGEDLGTVPKGFRETMAEANILSYRVLFFEKDENDFLAPSAYPRLAIAVEGSHDLPTLRAWWTGADLDLKEKLHLYPRASDAEQARVQRAQDREALVTALRAEGLADQSMDSERLFSAAHAYLALTASALALVQLDDITNEESPVNVPTTSTEHPNWRRKIGLDLDEIQTSARFSEVSAIFTAARGR